MVQSSAEDVDQYLAELPEAAVARSPSSARCAARS